MKKLPFTRRVAIGGAIAVAIAGGGSAVALATGQTASDVYQGCLSHNLGAVYNVKVNPRTPPACLRRDTLVSWNQTGPAGTPGTPGAKGDAGARGATGPAGSAGPQGPKGETGAGSPGAKGDAGPRGPQGDTGATGRDGVSGYEVVTGNDVTNWPGTQTGGAAACPAGKVVIGGGVSGNGGTEQSINSSRPGPDDTDWVAYVNNTGTIARSFNVYAICAVPGP